MNTCACQALLEARSTGHPTPTAIAQLEFLGHCPEPKPALVMTLIQQLSEATTQTMAELQQQTQILERLAAKLIDCAARQECGRSLESRLAEISQRRRRFATWQTTLTATLNQIVALQPALYAEEFVAFDLDNWLTPVLDGDESLLPDQLAQLSTQVQITYADFKLRRLAVTSCVVQAAAHKIRRTRLACRWFPAIGGVVAAYFLQLSVEGLWTIGLTGGVVLPLILWITRAMRQEMRAIAQQEWQEEQMRLDEECQRLHEQETLIRYLCDCLVNSDAALPTTAIAELRLLEPIL